MTQIFSQVAGDIGTAFGSNTLPDFDGILGEWWFGGSEAASKVNAITGAPATVLGAPIYSPGYATMGYQNGILTAGYSTDVVGTSAFSIAMLIRPSAGQALAVVPTGEDGANYNMYLVDTGHISAGQGGASGSSDQAILPISTANFTLVMGVFVTGARGRVYRIDANGTVLDDGGDGVPYIFNRTASTVQLGGRVSENSQGRFDIGAMAVAAGARDQGWLAAIYPRYAAYADSRGLTVN